MTTSPLWVPGADVLPGGSDNTYRWATVTQPDPLRIRLDGDTTELPVTPDTLVSPGNLTVGTRVWVQLFGRRLIVIGTPGQSSATSLQTFSGSSVIADTAANFTWDSAIVETDGRWAHLYARFSRTTSALSAGTSGNIVNASLGHVKPEWFPYGGGPSISSGAYGQVATGYLDANGQLVVSALAPGVDWTVGLAIDFHCTYPLAVPLPSVAPTIITPGPSPYSSWQTPTLLNSWVAYGSGWNAPRWRQLSTGEVVCAGLIKSGTVGINTPMFYVPASLAPEGLANVGELYIVQASGGTARIDVTNDGRVAVNALGTGATNAFISLNGVRWMPAGV